MTTKTAKRRAVQAIRQIVSAARQLAEAERALLVESPPARRRRGKAALAERAAQRKEAATR
jgi:hypothetical protein